MSTKDRWRFSRVGHNHAAEDRLIRTWLAGAMLLVMVATTAFTGCDQARRNSVKLANQGVKATNRQEYDAALRFLTRAIAIDPSNPDAQYELGQLYILSDKSWYDPAKAIHHLTLANQLNPNDRDVLFNLARVQLTAGDPELGLDYLERVLVLDPNHEGSWYFKGNYLHDKQDYAGADAAWREAIAINPSKARSYAALGQLYERVEAEDAAMAVYKEGVHHSRRDTEVLGHLARLLLETEQYQEAVNALAEVHNREAPGPIQNKAMFNLASAYALWADATSEENLRGARKKKALLTLQAYLANADPSQPLYKSAKQFRRQLRQE